MPYTDTSTRSKLEMLIHVGGNGGEEQECWGVEERLPRGMMNQIRVSNDHSTPDLGFYLDGYFRNGRQDNVCATTLTACSVYMASIASGKPSNCRGLSLGSTFTSHRSLPPANGSVRRALVRP